MQLIRLLADGSLHSGETLAAQLGMSRAAVWKALRRVRDRFGLALVSERGRGYRLETPIELLDPACILGALSPRTRDALADLQIHQQIDSTSRHLMRASALGAASGTICLAEHQTAGRGRLGRLWVSPYGANLYLSGLWRFPSGPAGLGALSLAAGVVVADVLQRAGAQGVGLKWPNDVLWCRRKLAGILLEVTGEAQGPCVLVLGVGVNLRMTRRAGQGIDQPWVDLTEVLGESGAVSRNRLAANLIDGLSDAIERFLREGLEPFLSGWHALDVCRGHPVRLSMGERKIDGTALGVGMDGALCLSTLEGERRFHAGEVSLRRVGTRECDA